MDEKKFLDKWISESTNLHCSVSDVREKVWERIAEAARTPRPVPAESDISFSSTLFKLDIAAVVVIAVGTGMLYFLLSDLSIAVFRNAALQAMAGAYYF